jgi:hypothetical protein
MIAHFLGKYNLSVPYDLCTKEFTRDQDGSFANYHDVRIDCKKGFICHWGRSTLLACFDSIEVKNNVLKKLDPNIIIDRDYNWYDFSFNVKDIEPVAEAMGARTSHKNRNPFSPKNLPVIDYEPTNPELCTQLHKLMLTKHGYLGCTVVYKKYFKKYKIKYQEERIKFVYILDKYNKLEEVYKRENEY